MLKNCITQAVNKIIKQDNKEQPFESLANDWWNPVGKFKLLHDYNEVRLPYIIKAIKSNFNIINETELSNLDLLDVGCGGGLIAEPLAKLNINVTAIDTSKNAINVAKQHASSNNVEVNYLNKELKNLDSNLKFDIILALEILEHVDNVNDFIEKLLQFAKPNSIIVFSTINRNLKSLLLAKLTAEYILRWLPAGIHEYKKFIKPFELEKCFNIHNFNIKSLHGVKFNIMQGKWELNEDSSMNYIGYAINN